MAIFTFDPSHELGRVRSVDTRRVEVQVDSNQVLRRARVGHLVAIELPGVIEEWLVGIIERVVKTPVIEEQLSSDYEDDDGVDDFGLEMEGVSNTVRVSLVGAVEATLENDLKFSRSLIQVPEIDGECFVLRDAQLRKFMSLLSNEGATESSLEIGRYTIDINATAYLDGNKFFQRHASLLGSTGSGKSWAVATILEQAANLASANIVVFDLHGEYSQLSYAHHLRIPGPEELGKSDDSLLFLPFWLLNIEELQTMFIDSGEFSARNQVTAFQDAIVAEKTKNLEELKKEDVLEAFTIDSPIPFSIESLVDELRILDRQMVPGARGERQGPFYGQFSRLIIRLESRISDKRYGFLFNAPPSAHMYESMANLMERLMDFSQKKTQIKVIDFSEVPADILPVILGLVARVIFQVQFWTDRAERQPIALVCDEAHMYLPNKEGRDLAERRAIENFEKIAKEGRKYGVALLVVSQRPSDVSPTILSQCSNIVSLRLTNGVDQTTVRRLMPESLEGLLDTLPILDIGEALVVGDSVLLPSRIRVHAPEEKPLSATINFWDEWSKVTPAPNFAKAVENMRRQNRT